MGHKAVCEIGVIIIHLKIKGLCLPGSFYTVYEDKPCIIDWWSVSGKLLMGLA